MRFDLGTLDSGERSLPFGLLVLMSALRGGGLGGVLWVGTGSAMPMFLALPDIEVSWADMIPNPVTLYRYYCAIGSCCRWHLMIIVLGHFHLGKTGYHYPTSEVLVFR